MFVVAGHGWPGGPEYAWGASRLSRLTNEGNIFIHQLKVRLMIIFYSFSNTEIFINPFYFYKSNFDFGNQLICPSFNILSNFIRFKSIIFRFSRNSKVSQNVQILLIQRLIRFHQLNQSEPGREDCFYYHWFRYV